MLTKTIREDKTYKRAKKRLDLIKGQLDLDLLITELFSLQTNRASAAIKKSRVLRDSLSVIIESSVDEISTRSRATTIHMQCLQALLEIDEITSHLSKYIMSRYASALKDEGATTITAQKATIEVILRLFYEPKKKLETIMKMASLVQEDIDKSSYSLSRVQNAVEVSSKDR